MTYFLRSPSGIANLHRFHGADFMVFTEGRIPFDPIKEQQAPVDVFYYEFLLSAASGGRKPKVKCVGNKATALEYAKRIQNDRITKTIVIVDKDFEGVTSSPLPIFPIIRTYGYSWENELWAANNVKAVLIQITNATAEVNEQVDKYVPRLAKRLKFLALLDAAAQTSGIAILNKGSSLGGVHYSYPNITAKEVGRIANKFKNSTAANCPIARQILTQNAAAEFGSVIQGHFWANMIMQFIISLYKKINNDTAPSKTVLLNLALSNLKLNPNHTVGQALILRYASELARVGI